MAKFWKATGRVIGMGAAGAIGIVAIIGLAALLSAPLAGIAMLLVGVAHGFNDTIPPLGFFELWALIFALRVAIAKPQVHK